MLHHTCASQQATKAPVLDVLSKPRLSALHKPPPGLQPQSKGTAAEVCVCVPNTDTAAITGHWSNITATVLPSNISLLETAELYAKLHVAFYDSNIAGWYIKFTSLFWRPVTAIQ